MFEAADLLINLFQGYGFKLSGNWNNSCLVLKNGSRSLSIIIPDQYSDIGILYSTNYQVLAFKWFNLANPQSLAIIEDIINGKCNQIQKDDPPPTNGNQTVAIPKNFYHD